MELETLVHRLHSHLLRPMKSAFVAKDEIVDLMGVALVAGENLFLLGPPGTAKSALVHEMGRLLAGRTFDYLLTRFTEPNEIFGPFDIRRLREGDLVTNTEGMLPEADLVFLDELLNANSAILNSLLMALNERVFRRGRETRSLPALFFVGASNHLPEEEALRALFDRFLLRAHCTNAPEDSLEAVLNAGWRLETREHAPAEVSAGELRGLQKLAREVDLAPARPAYLDLVKRLRAAGLALSDRRAVKLQRVVAASALLCGRREARASDLWVLRHIWDTEEQQEWLAAIVEEALRQTDKDPADHPRSRAGAPPDPENLARELAELAEEWNGLPLTMASDRLAALGARIEWVPDEVPREDLRQRLEILWQKARTHSA